MEAESANPILLKSVKNAYYIAYPESCPFLMQICTVHNDPTTFPYTALNWNIPEKCLLQYGNNISNSGGCSFISFWEPWPGLSWMDSHPSYRPQREVYSTLLFTSLMSNHFPVVTRLAETLLLLLAREYFTWFGVLSQSRIYPSPLSTTSIGEIPSMSYKNAPSLLSCPLASIISTAVAPSPNTAVCHPDLQPIEVQKYSSTGGLNHTLSSRILYVPFFHNGLLPLRNSPSHASFQAFAQIL